MQIAICIIAALDYLENGEFPELIRLRVDMLIETDCENFALNLCSWCVKSSKFERDVYIRQIHLLLLYKFDKKEEFHNTVKLSGKELLQYTYQYVWFQLSNITE